MDLLKQCADAFEHLCSYKYHFVLGRKGNRIEFTLGFEKSDFHHIAGLHKLKDIAQIQQGGRDKVFNKILADDINLELIERSDFYDEMSGRLMPLANMESMLDSDQLIFRYNEKVHKFSVIKADYLIEGKAAETAVFLFLGARENSEDQMCRTLFPKGNLDYTQGQPQYTLLKKEKIHLSDGTTEILYDRTKK